MNLIVWHELCASCPLWLHLTTETRLPSGRQGVHLRTQRFSFKEFFKHLAILNKGFCRIDYSFRQKSMLMFKFLLLVFIASVDFSSAIGQSAGEAITVNMKKLHGFTGTWKAKTTFHLRNGGTTTETGTYKIKWTLDSSYLHWEIELENDSTKRRRFMLILMTFNRDSSRYEVNYFYARSAMKVFEIGSLNNDNEFLTSAFVPMEDGQHDEYVRTITSFIAPDTLQYLHFSRFDYEKTERKDFEAILTRMN